MHVEKSSAQFTEFSDSEFNADFHEFMNSHLGRLLSNSDICPM